LSSAARTARQFHRIVVGPEMDEEHTRLLVEHVAMDRGHLDIPGSQRANNACCQPLAEIMSWSPENGNGPARKNREHLGLDVRSGSKADLKRRMFEVRSSPNSGHSSVTF
jgi:hypothetical protein